MIIIYSIDSKFKSGFFISEGKAKMTVPSPQLMLQLFEASCSPDQTVRRQAEESLKLAEASDGFLSLLLPTLIQYQSNALALSMAVYCKNRIKAAWRPHDPALVIPIGPEDRVFIKVIVWLTE